MNHLLWILEFILGAIFSFNIAWLLWDERNKRKIHHDDIDFVEDNFSKGDGK